MAEAKEKALADYRKKLMEHKEVRQRIVNLEDFLMFLFLGWRQAEGAKRPAQRPDQAIWQVGERPEGSAECGADCRWGPEATHGGKVHCEGNKWTKICRWMQATVGESKTKARNQSCSGYDNSHHHEISTKRGRSKLTLAPCYYYMQPRLLE